MNERDEGSSTINYKQPTKAPLGSSHGLQTSATSATSTSPPIFREKPFSVGGVPFSRGSVSSTCGETNFISASTGSLHATGVEVLPFSYLLRESVMGDFNFALSLILVRGNFGQSNTRHIFTLRFAYQVCHIIANLQLRLSTSISKPAITP